MQQKFKRNFIFVAKFGNFAMFKLKMQSSLSWREHPMIPAAPMIANAIDDATGIRIKSMPITAEKVCLAMMEKEVKS